VPHQRLHCPPNFPPMQPSTSSSHHAPPRVLCVSASTNLPQPVLCLCRYSSILLLVFLIFPVFLFTLFFVAAFVICCVCFMGYCLHDLNCFDLTTETFVVGFGLITLFFQSLYRTMTMLIRLLPLSVDCFWFLVTRWRVIL
jgi:hypothetical protein